MMKDRFIKNIYQKKLFSEKDKILLAISGGADSVCLALLLKESGFNFEMVHCNFMIRGKESDQDEKFVSQLARSLDVQFFSKSFSTVKYAKQKRLSVQMAARELRYNWFEDVRKKTNSDFIAVAHNQEDNQETFFINLIRGTGIRGLMGIDVKKRNIVRPLLPFSRLEIEKYLNERKQEFRQDSSNKDVKYLRNNIRSNILPLIKEINPSFDKTLINDMNFLNEVFEVFLDQIKTYEKSILKKTDNEIIIYKKDILSLRFPKAILREILLPYGFNQIDKIVESLSSGIESGSMFYSKTHVLLINREKILIRNLEKLEDVNIEIYQDLEDIDFPCNMEFYTSNKFSYDSDIQTEMFDYERLRFPLILRNWKKGDYFYPLGMDQKKKLSDFFIDNKISIFDKSKALVLCSNNDIIWVVGYRIDDRYKINNNTKKAYIAKVF